jgi:anti-anti-sigma factor
VAKLPAVLDLANAMDVRNELDELLVNGVTILIADMTATTTLALEGLQALVLVRATAIRRGSQLRLAAPQPAVRQYMNLTGTSGLIPLYDTIDQARR